MRLNLNIFRSLPLLLVWALVASLVLVTIFDPGRGLGIGLASVAIFLGISGFDEVRPPAQ